MQRERQILRLDRRAAARIPDIVANAYPGLDPRLVPAAGGSVLAHLVDLERRGLVERRGRAMDRRLNKPLVLAMVVVALVLGVVLGVTTGIADRIFGGPNPKTIASASLESMRAQNRLIAFVARYVSVVSSESNGSAGWSARSARSILPGDVRYELDLSKLAARTT